MRDTTKRVLEAIEEGILDRDTVLLAALNHLSEDDVREMCEANGFLELDDDEEEEDPEESGPDHARLWYDTSAELA